jgi:hypothetical protein
MKTIYMKKEGGRVSLSAELDYLFSTLSNGSYTITVKRTREKRTINQNALMWAWFACIEENTGTSKDDIYMYYCKKFLSRVVCVNNKEEKIYRTSSMLSTVEMSEFMTKIQADAGSELGITLPIPDDRYFEEFYEQYKR